MSKRRLFDRGDQVELAKAVLADLGPDTVFSEGALYLYSEAHWRQVESDEANRAVYKYAGASVKGEKGFKPLRMSKDFATGTVGVAHDLVAKKSFFADAPAGVSFANCFMAAERQLLVRHRNGPERRNRHSYQFDYDEVPRCHRFIKMLDEVWEDDDAEAKKALLQEYVGACMVGLGAKLKKAVILAGDTDTGKSTVLTAIQTVFPPGSVSAVRPSEFSQEYSRAQLAGSLCNVVSELPETDWLEPSAFKALTGDDLISARHPYGRAFFYVAKAGHVYAANALPRIADRSDASWNRLVIVTFNHRFWSNPAEGQKAKVKGLVEDILANEREGIVSWALEGLRRLLKNRMVLTEVGSSDEAVTTLRNESDQLRLFFDDRVEIAPVGPRNNPEVDEVFTAYKSWAQHTRHQVLPLSRFGREFKGLLVRMTGVADPRSKNSRGRRTYVGIRVNKQPYDSSY